ncbi:UBX domain-containing protein [Jimgerdemannia flammicorona]|uniref:UBX domain-containing protein n=1 Tax=Jimgerdemannia flammicorona TaxID=994334 RepID=A0A433QNX7_9FUNG|nr:UBX domain-containing protein [Jimgerdemannia flammicorona]
MTNRDSHSNLSIRLLDGSTLRNKFEATDTLEIVRDWLQDNRTDGDTPYNLLQTFPHRQFSAGDETRDLRDLGLTPSGTLIMKAAKAVSNAYGGNGAASGVSTGVWGYVESAVGVATTIVGGVASIVSGLVGSVMPAVGGDGGGGAVLGGEHNEDKDGANARRLAAQRGSSAGSSSSSLSDSRSGTPRLGRRPFGANIATLSQFGDEDSDDPDSNSTYNGNSTNQE